MGGIPNYNPFAPPIFPNIQAPNQGPTSPNFVAARDSLNLNPAEQNLYQRHLANLYGPGGVDNTNGSRSTLYQGTEPHNGRYYNIPTVWDGQIETQKYNGRNGWMDIPNPQALQNVANAGWQNFPSYPTMQQADDRYQQMHGFMEKDTNDYEKAKPQLGGLLSALGLK